jgi:hypothetical protein
MLRLLCGLGIGEQISAVKTACLRQTKFVPSYRKESVRCGKE